MTRARVVEPTKGVLREILEYNPDGGVFKWKIEPACQIKVGDIAGSLNKITGYFQLGYNYQVFQSHRLAYIYVHGKIPHGLCIDHIDGDKSNNRICNLRLCSLSENHMNVGLSKHNTSGCRGVNWNKLLGKWQVRVTLGGNRINLGLYVDKDEAVAVCKAFQLKHHGEFYRDTTIT